MMRDIKKEYLDRLTDYCKGRGWELTAYQNIPKVDEFTARLIVCLIHRPNDLYSYIVYTFNADDGGFYDGNYNRHCAEAWAAFGNRVHRLWPTYNNESVPEDAPEDYFKQMIDKEDQK